MTPDELRTLQAPLKARYREDPAAAVVTLRAAGDIGSGNVTCKLTTGRALVEAGLHPATGGTGLDACSGDVSCAGVTLRAVATALGIAIDGGTVTAEGDLDFRGTLGVAKDVPVGFREIRLNFDLQAASPPEQVAKLLELTERYCVVYQTLVKSPPVTITHRTTA